ncbi:hypothetical protein [Lysobacter tyrosinilyticus]
MSHMTLRNQTTYAAQFVVHQGQQILARIPGLEPGSSMQLPTAPRYEIIATTVIDGQTYVSAPLQADGAAGFLAQVVQEYAQGTYAFEVTEHPSSNSRQLQFQTTWRYPVTFTISKDGRQVQSIVVDDPFNVRVVDIGETFAIHAVINGITTATAITDNPSAVVTAIVDGSELEHGYFTLDVA